MGKENLLKLIFLLLCVFFTYANAGDVTYAAIEKTPLKLKNIDEYGVAFFSGSIILEGNYLVTLDAIDEEEFEPYVSFYPDSKSLKYLPAPHSSNEVYDTPPNAIFLTNGIISAKMLLSKSEYKSLMNLKRKFDKYSLEERFSESKNINFFRGFGRIKIDNYTTAIECDSRVYSARLVTVERTNNQLVVNSSGNLPC